MTDYIEIENLIFHKETNVKEYWIDMFKHPMWNMNYYDEPINNNSITYILLIESNYHQAFAHWVLEMAIFLPYYHKLKEILGGSLKIFIINKPYRSYKKLFLNYFNICDDDIIYCNEELKHNDYNEKWFKRFNVTLPKNNICITVPFVLVNFLPITKCQIEEDDFTNRISNFQQFFNIDEIIEQDIEWLFFPRASKENYGPNDRYINYTSITNFLKDKNHIVYDTIETQNLIDQIRLVKRAKNLILDPTSSFLVNGLFCRNTNIYLSSPKNFMDRSFELVYNYITLTNNVCAFKDR